MSAVESSHDGDTQAAAAAAAGQEEGASLSEPGVSSAATSEQGGGNDAGQDFGWEGCKENVKPLKRGRKVDAINAGAFGGGLGGGGGGRDSGCSSSARVLADLKR